MQLNGISVTFLPMDSLQKLPEKPKYSNLFNTLYFSARLEHVYVITTYIVLN